MCIAILNSPKFALPKKTIYNSYKNNSDGTGFIWTEGGVLRTHKTMEGAKKVWQFYKSLRSRVSGYIVLHFRIATSGGVNIENCHPFIVNDNLAFVHNGVISGLGSLKQSDTNEFCEFYLKKMPSDFLEYSGITKMIEEVIGHSKLVFLDSEDNPTIINHDMGHFDEHGNWYSNTTYQYSYNYGSYGSYYGGYGVDYSKKWGNEYWEDEGDDDKKWVRNKNGEWQVIKTDKPAVTIVPARTPGEVVRGVHSVLGAPDRDLLYDEDDEDRDLPEFNNSFQQDCDGCTQHTFCTYDANSNAFLCRECERYFK